MKQHPIAPGRGTLVARTALEVDWFTYPDVLADPEYTGTGSKTRRISHPCSGCRAREGRSVGVIAMKE